MFLMPSQYEPCGLNQMYSLRYGTMPIVRRTGGLADSVQHFDPVSRRGTGVVFNDYDVGAVTWGVETALAWYAQTNRCGSRWCRTPWRRTSRGRRASRDYVALYERCAAESAQLECRPSRRRGCCAACPRHSVTLPVIR